MQNISFDRVKQEQSEEWDTVMPDALTVSIFDDYS